MSVRTLKEIRDNVGDTARETQIDSLIDEFINLTLQEINDPAWATKGYNHSWSFNRRKDTFNTVASTEFYQLPRDLDKISLIRQIESPIKLKYYPDDIFYREIPDPTAEGNPKCYRLWEEEGVEIRLATDDTVTVVSDSASDGASITVSVVGYDDDSIRRSEAIILNGTTAVPGTITFDANKPLRISKSADTEGVITVTETSGGTTLVKLGEHERSPRFKVIGLYPIPNGAISLYLEYFTRIRRLEHNASVPGIDEKWIWVVRQGALAKVYQYQNKESMYISTQALYTAGVHAMVKADLAIPDYIPTLKSRRKRYQGIIELSDGNYAAIF